MKTMSFENWVNALGSGLQTAKVRLEDVRARHESAGYRPVLKALECFVDSFKTVFKTFKVL